MSNNTPIATEREKKLVDLMFTMALVSYDRCKNNPRLTREQVTDYVRDQLREIGFNVSDPVGQSWGLLQNGRYIKS